jgi:hypothetical protein
MRSRFGVFLICLGLFLVAIFIFSDMAGTPIFGYFCFGAISLLMGVVLAWRSATPSPQQQDYARFRSVRMALERSKAKKKK